MCTCSQLSPLSVPGALGHTWCSCSCGKRSTLEDRNQAEKNEYVMPQVQVKAQLDFSLGQQPSSNSKTSACSSALWSLSWLQCGWQVWSHMWGHRNNPVWMPCIFGTLLSSAHRSSHPLALRQVSWPGHSCKCGHFVVQCCCWTSPWYIWSYQSVRPCSFTGMWTGSCLCRTALTLVQLLEHVLASTETGTLSVHIQEHENNCSII